MPAKQLRAYLDQDLRNSLKGWLPDSMGSPRDNDRDLSGAAFECLAGRVARGACMGAEDVAADPTVLREAVERTIERFEDAWIRGKAIHDPEAWAFRVGRTEARGLGRRRKTVSLERLGSPESPPEGSRAGTPPLSGIRYALRNARDRLTEKQKLAVGAVLRYGSVKGAARALGKDASGLRRLFSRALARLRRPHE